MKDGVWEYLASNSMPNMLVVSWLVTMIIAAAAAAPAAASRSTMEMSRCSFAIPITRRVCYQQLVITSVVTDNCC